MLTAVVCGRSTYYIVTESLRVFIVNKKKTPLKRSNSKRTKKPYPVEIKFFVEQSVVYLKETVFTHSRMRSPFSGSQKMALLHSIFSVVENLLL